ncbi:MAG TPA: alkaline phosphatase family protein [Candidatus Cybelea sp.]|nr:alkaline phosphatase family protein [Candidatus Cybelea sp.]
MLAFALAGCGGSSLLSPSGASLQPSSGTGSSPIQHVVMIVQENRSFDNLFADFPGVNGGLYGYEKVKKGTKWVEKKVPLRETTLLPSKNHDIGHCYYAFIQAYDSGKMDGFDYEPNGACPRSWTGGSPSKLYPYFYVNPTNIESYWDMAQQYVIADNMFQTQGSGSFSAHQDLIRGGSALGGAYGTGSSLIDTPTGIPWGCDAPPGTTTDLITTSLKWEEDAGPLPCTKDFGYTSSSYATLASEMDDNNVTWKYYTPCFKNSPGSCTPKCNPCAGSELNAFDVIWSVRNSKEWGTNVSMPETNIFADISDGNLPAVSWVIPEDNNSDHLGEPKDLGPQWVASVVNAVGGSKYWNSTAIIILWDDWGGLYDHVAPPFRDDQGGLGFRVPMLVVSPYSKLGSGSGGYVSHTQYEFGSVLKYVEQNFGLPSLGTTDQRANSISDTLNYNQNPRAFKSIPSSLNAQYFIAHQRPSHGDPE